MCWGFLALFLKIQLLRSFQTSQMKKPRTKFQDLLMISLLENFFLQFFKALEMLSLSLSVCVNIEATHSHMVEVKGQRLRR